MSSPLNQRLLADAPLPTADGDALLRSARALRQTAAEAAQGPLQGKHIAVLVEGRDPQAVREFEAAATALGAQVSCLPPDAVLPGGDLGKAKDTLRMLARLYDAVAFEGLQARAAPGLQRALGLPVCGVGLGRTASIEPLLAALGGDAEATAQDRVFLLQAVMLQALGR